MLRYDECIDEHRDYGENKWYFIEKNGLRLA